MPGSNKKMLFDISGGKADDDSNFLGFSFPFISDSVMNEIELLKKKWLPKYWTSEGEDMETETKDEDKSNIVRLKQSLF